MLFAAVAFAVVVALDVAVLWHGQVFASAATVLHNLAFIFFVRLLRVAFDSLDSFFSLLHLPFTDNKQYGARQGTTRHGPTVKVPAEVSTKFVTKLRDLCCIVCS